MIYTMIGSNGNDNPKTLNVFNASNHQEARKIILSLQDKYETIFIKTETTKGKVRSYSISTVYSKW